MATKPYCLRRLWESGPDHLERYKAEWLYAEKQRQLAGSRSGPSWKRKTHSRSTVVSAYSNLILSKPIESTNLSLGETESETAVDSSGGFLDFCKPGAGSA